MSEKTSAAHPPTVDHRDFVKLAGVAAAAAGAPASTALAQAGAPVQAPDRATIAQPAPPLANDE